VGLAKNIKNAVGQNMDKTLQSFFLKVKKVFVPCQENNWTPKIFLSSFLNWIIFLLFVLRILFFFFFLNLSEFSLFADISRQILFELTNKARQEVGVPPLKESPKLNQAAFLKAQDMLEKDYFAHTSPEGITPWEWFKKAGYFFKAAGENLAIGFFDSEELLQAWLNSKSHRENILNPNFKEIGLAVVKGEYQGFETFVVVQLFGTPQSEVVQEKKSAPSKTQEAEKIVDEKKKLPKKIAEELQIKEPKETQVEEKGTSQKTPEISQNLPSPEEVLPPKITPPQYPAREIKGVSVYFLKSVTILSFIARHYDTIIKTFLLMLLNLILFSLFLDFVFWKKIPQKKEIVFRGIIYLLMLIVLYFLDKRFFIELLPGNFEIL